METVRGSERKLLPVTEVLTALGMLRALRALVTLLAVGLAGQACASSGSEDQTSGHGGKGGDGGIVLGLPSSPDGGKKSGDAATDAPPPVEATIHAIDTGLIPNGTIVHVQSAILVAPIRNAGVDSVQECTFDAFLEDPSASAPAGIRVFVDVLPCVGELCSCPAVGSLPTLIDSMTTPGDTFEITGAAETYTYDAGPLEHGIFVTLLTKTGTGATIAPVVVSDPITMGTFEPGGSGYSENEGMLVTIAPPTGLAVNNVSYGTFLAGNVLFGGEYLEVEDGGLFPPDGSTWSKITGVVWTAHGGAVVPRSASDFTP